MNNRKDNFYSFRAAVGKDHFTINLIKYGRMEFVNDWKKWIDWAGYGFEKIDDKIKFIQPDKNHKSKLYDLWGRAHPSTWIDKSEKFYVIENDKEKIIWFWEKNWRNNKDQILRCASKNKGDWIVQSPLFFGWEVAGNILSTFLEKGNDSHIKQLCPKYKVVLLNFKDEVIKSLLC